MSSADDVTSDFIIAEETNGNSLKRSVLTVADADKMNARIRDRRDSQERDRICNCTAYRRRPKGHSTKCRSYRSCGWNPRGATENYTEGSVQYSLFGIPAHLVTRARRSWSLAYTRRRQRW